jgi:hypothetical protein
MMESERISWILYRKKQILFEDYSGLNGTEMLEVLQASKKIFDSLREPVPVLLDFSRSIISNEFMNEFMRLGGQYVSLIKKGASIGVDGPKKALSTMYFVYTGQGHKSKICETKDEALEYLVEPLNSNRAVEAVS